MRRFNITTAKFVFSLGVVLLFFSFAVSAAPLTTGESLPELNLPDQHGDSHTLSNGNMVLFAPDKGAGKLAHEVLNHTDKVEMVAVLGKAPAASGLLSTPVMVIAPPASKARSCTSQT